MKLLLVNACCRGEASRTLRLAETLLEALRARVPDIEITEHDLYAMKLLPIDAQTLPAREACCDARNWTHALTCHALDFLQADMVLIAAPYWDLSFPSVLKIWVEHMWVRNLTFVYRNDLPVGLCRGKVCAYVTTSGSPIGALDFGAEYIRGVAKTLGIPGFVRLSAEALDLDSSDPEQILREAEARAEAAADAMLAQLGEGGAP